MSPPLLLLLLALLTTAAAGGAALQRWRWSRRFQRLAAERRMHYVRDDRFRLVTRVAPPPAGDAVVRDVIYCQRNGYHYVFTLEYTQAGQRHRIAAGFAEPIEQSAAPVSGSLLPAPPQLPLLEQYRHLLDRIECL